MDRKEIEILLRKIIARHVPDVEPEAIKVDSKLTGMGVDSLAFGYILTNIEDTFDLEMRGSDILKLKTLSDAIDYVEQHMAR